MKDHAALFFRGFVIVTLTAWNVRHIASMQYAGALVGGFAISFVWFGNSRQAAQTELKWAREAYACGAACGTCFGMWLGR
jgi:hypothetical protein